MKIGILSLNPGHNYGGILQSYALQTVLEKMGHEVKIISIKRRNSPYHPSLYVRYIVRFFRKYTCGSQVDVFAEKKQNEIYLKVNEKLLDFCKERLNLRLITNIRDIDSTEFNAIVVGSDQVWRPRYFRNQFFTTITNAYLKFTKDWNIKRISYAPSFGVSEWEYTPEDTLECAKLLQIFNGVSVREQDGVDLCKKFFNVDAVCVCDPTILLSKIDYENLINESTPKSKGDLLVYCLDKSEELNKLVERISIEKSLIPFYTNVDEKGTENIKISIASWIRGFIDAKFIVTDSFHACVFSLIFQKPFVVLGNRERGMSRFEGLLKTFKQEKRLLYDISEFDYTLMTPSFDEVNDIVNILKKKSLDFLESNLR